MSKGIKTSLAGFVFLTAILIAITGCGDDTGESLKKRDIPADATAEKLLLEAVKATNEAESIHYLTRYMLEVPQTQTDPRGVAIEMSGEGDLDVSTKNSRSDYKWMGIDISFIVHDGKQFFKRAGTQYWYEIPEGAGLSSPNVAEMTTDFSKYLENFKSINRMEDAVINTRDCYHLKVEPNLEATVEQHFENLLTVPDDTFESDLESLKQQIKDQGLSARYEFWIDKEYLVYRRMIVVMDMRVIPQGESDPTNISVSFELDFPSYNQGAEIVPPEVSMPWKPTQ